MSSVVMRNALLRIVFLVAMLFGIFKFVRLFLAV